MKLLSLYIDKWYIIGAVNNSDGITRPIELPSKEERIWLYFYEDTGSDEISYGRCFQEKYRNNENHYYGNVFSLITLPSVKYIRFGLPQSIIGIFKDARIFDDIRQSIGEVMGIETFVSFSKDITNGARWLFLRELEKEGFIVKQYGARIGHLALEYAAQQSSIREDGYYIVLDACNENLHYALYEYQHAQQIFVRVEEDMLQGKGTDVRKRALIEYVVDNINDREHFLQSKEERETEYLRMTQFVDSWLEKLNGAGGIPIQLTDITLSKDPYKKYSVQIMKQKINERTKSIVKNIVDIIVRFIKDCNVKQEQLKGIVFLGNTFDNSQYEKELCTHYNLSEEKMIHYYDTDFPYIVNIYSLIDCSQFSAIEQGTKATGEAELRRIRQLEEEKEKERKAMAEAEAKTEQERKAIENDRNFRDAMDKGYDAEQKQNYSEMEEYFRIALNLQPDNEEAKQKYDEAIRKKTELSVKQDNYKKKIQEAKRAFDNGEWETAKQKADEALSYMSQSPEANRIKKEAARLTTASKDFERYLDRVDLFVAQKAYKEALEEIEKAKLLGIRPEEIKSREKKIVEEQTAASAKISNLLQQMNDSLTNKEFEKAEEACSALIDLDLPNSKKWSTKLSEITLQKRKADEDSKRFGNLVGNINAAIWDENWTTVASLCREALALRSDPQIQERLTKAEGIIKKQQEAENIEKEVQTIKDLILKKEFKAVKAKLKSIESSLDPSKVRELRRLIFEMEDKVEKANLRATNGRSNVSDNEEDWNFGHSQKNKQNSNSKHKKEKPGLSDSFFDDVENECTHKLESNNKPIKRHLSNDDFDRF